MRQAGSVSRFLVGSSSLSQAFTTVQLQGDFSFDAISNDGKSLYLIQKMGDPNHYQVRLYDLGTQSLAAQPVADKREPREPMNGIRGDSVADPTGKYVFTVYARNNGPFIHALPLGQPVAWCLDLPAKSASDIEEQFHWSLVSNRDGSLVYAVNGSSGFIAEIAPDNLPSLRRSVHVAMNASSGLLGGLVTNADAKGALIGGSALSPDGRTLFALGDTGIVVIDVGTLKVRSRILTGDVIESIRLGADGHWLYAAGGASGIWQINPATAAVAGQVKGGSATWALLWAEPK
jgi:hypothetical protein